MYLRRFAVFADAAGLVVWVGDAVSPLAACSLAAIAYGEPVSEFRSRPLAPAEDRINHLEVSVFDISTIAPKANLNFVRQHMAMCVTPETAAGEFAAAYAE
jgi:hypothetical protein